MKLWCACSATTASRFPPRYSCRLSSNWASPSNSTRWFSIWRSATWRPCPTSASPSIFPALRRRRPTGRNISGIRWRRIPDVARRMVVEITETAAIVDIAETRRFVDTLRELGGRVSLDDFGAGSTSIRYLRELGISFMKIDKDLLKDIFDQQRTAASGVGADRTGARPWHRDRRRRR